MVFFNLKHKAEEATKFLKSHLPLKLHNQVHWLHCGMTAAIWTEEIKKMVDNEQWGLVLTDIGGMNGESEVISESYCLTFLLGH